MKQRKVISGQNFRIRLPLGPTIWIGLLMDRLGAPEWVWGVFVCAMSWLWLTALLDLFKSTEPVDIFKEVS